MSTLLLTLRGDLKIVNLTTVTEHLIKELGIRPGSAWLRPNFSDLGTEGSTVNLTVSWFNMDETEVLVDFQWEGHDDMSWLVHAAMRRICRKIRGLKHHYSEWTNAQTLGWIPLFNGEQEPARNQEFFVSSGVEYLRDVYRRDLI